MLPPPAARCLTQEETGGGEGGERGAHPQVRRRMDDRSFPGWASAARRNSSPASSIYAWDLWGKRERKDKIEGDTHTQREKERGGGKDACSINLLRAAIVCAPSSPPISFFFFSEEEEDNDEDIGNNNGPGCVCATSHIHPSRDGRTGGKGKEGRKEAEKG